MRVSPAEVFAGESLTTYNSGKNFARDTKQGFVGEVHEKLSWAKLKFVKVSASGEVCSVKYLDRILSTLG